MLIDSHVHFGSMDKFHMPSDMLMESLKKYHIDIALVSNIEACEFDCDLKTIPRELVRSQAEVNEDTLNLLKKYPDKLKGLYWIKPHTEEFDKKVGEFLLTNNRYFVGLKMHPYHSDITIMDKRCEKYLQFANEHNMTFAVHTASDEKSDPYQVYLAAQKYPNINFIMVHLGLGTDNSKAIEYISELDNLYGDTTWVSLENTLKAVEKCGSHKIMYGTDNPIDGVDTYEKYQNLLEGLKSSLSKSEFENVTYKNAVRLFNLK